LRPYKIQRRAGQAPPLQISEGDRLESLSHLCVGAVAFFVFFAGAAGAGIVAAYFGAGTDGFGGFGLGWAGLILQFFLLPFLLALHFAGKGGEALWRRFAGAGGCACYGGGAAAGALTRWLLRARWGSVLRRRLAGCSWASLRGLVALLDLNVEEVADGFVVDASHHVFEEDEGFFFEFD
jgi:hypothetical protein